MTTKGITMVQMGWRVIHRIAAAALLLLFGTSAQALIYTGHFDPPGNGADIPGFTGDAVFDINQECFDLGDGWHDSGTDNSCGPSLMTNAIVQLYTTSPSDPLTTPIDSFTLGQFPVWGVLIEGGQLAGVDTDPMGPAQGSTVYTSQFFWLEFDSGCRFNSCFSAFTAALQDEDPAFLLVNDINDPGTANRSSPATVTFFPGNLLVPEPGTLSLILGAAGLGWLRRRNTRRN